MAAWLPLRLIARRIRSPRRRAGWRWPFMAAFGWIARSSQSQAPMMWRIASRPSSVRIARFDGNQSRSKRQMTLDVRALTFDVFGTVVDWRTGVIREGQAVLDRPDWPEIADKWRG